MQDKKRLLQKLKAVETMALASKFGRLRRNPRAYLFGILQSKLLFPLNRKAVTKKAATFFGSPIIISLPAGLDIFLTGGKTHDSEIRLTKYLIENLKPGIVFIDIGAHLGYYTLLASELVGPQGEIFSFEPSSIFSFLKENTISKKNVMVFKEAIADKNSEIDFYEFPVLYSEYNTIHIDQFKNENWIGKYRPRQTKIQGTTLDTFIRKQNIDPAIIKIDAEGAELNVLRGALQTLTSHSPTVVMEFIQNHRTEKNYILSHELMLRHGYISNIISPQGDLIPVQDIDQYLRVNNRESDNVVYKKE
jgi:FkbM family methyltransferase